MKNKWKEVVQLELMELLMELIEAVDHPYQHLIPVEQVGDHGHGHEHELPWSAVL